MSAGTGGTIAGVAAFLKQRDSAVRVVLADPTGSSLLGKVRWCLYFVLRVRCDI